MLNFLQNTNLFSRVWPTTTEYQETFNLLEHIVSENIWTNGYGWEKWHGI